MKDWKQTIITQAKYAFWAMALVACVGLILMDRILPR